MIKILKILLILFFLLIIISPHRNYASNIKVAKELDKYSGKKAKLVKEIYQKSEILFITAQAGNEWRTEEFKIFLELLSLLPEEYRNLKPLRFIKKSKKTKRIYKLFKRKRVVLFYKTLKNPEKLQKLFLRQLTIFLDYDQRISESWDWRKISRWTGWDIWGNCPENKNSSGYALEAGFKNPGEDFLTTTEIFFLSPKFTDKTKYLKYKIPSKYDFMQNLFKQKPDPQECINYNDTFKKWIDPAKVEHLEVLIASPSYVSIASIAGHIFLCLRTRDKTNTKKDLVFSFMADHMENRTEPDPDFEYILRGIFGKYKSHLLIESMEEMQYRYNVEENRDILRLKLNLSLPMIEKLIQRLWEMKTNFYYQFYFFTQNCTTMMTNLINYVLPGTHQISDRDFYDLPYNIGSKIYQQGIGRFIHPKYLSISNMAKFSAIENTIISDKIKHQLRSILNTKSIEKITGLLNKITRNPGGHNTLILYDNLVNFYLNLVSTPASADTINRIKDLLLEFLSHAQKIEKFKAHQAYTRHKPSKGFLKYYCNSREYLLLSDLTSRIKGGPDSDLNGSITYLQKPTGKMITYSKQQGRFSSHNCGYSLYRISPMVHNLLNHTFAGTRIRFSTFYEKLGSNSNFSLSQDSSMEFVTFGLDFFYKSTPCPQDSAKNWLTDYYFKYLEFEKIFTPYNLKSTNWFTPGMGLSFFESKSDKLNHIRMEVSVIKAKFLLNIYENNNFGQYLNLKVGTGFSYVDTTYSTKNFLDLSCELEGKFNLGYRGNGALRYHFTYCHRFNFKSGNIWDLVAGIEIDWYLDLWNGSNLSVGIAYIQKQLDILLAPDQVPPGNQLSFYTTLSFKGASPLRWINFKKLFNTIF